MIDKMYIMFKEFKYNRVDQNTFIKNLEKEYEKYRKQKLSSTEKDVIKTWASELFANGKISTKYNIKGKEQFYNTIRNWIESKWKSRTLDKNGAFYEETVGNDGKSTRASRNNEIFDIQWAVLTHEDTMNKMFNPGNFEIPKKTARIIKAAKAGSKLSYSKLSEKSINDLDSLAENSSSNIIFSTTQVAFHKQNMTAGKLIGVFANNNVSHAFLSMHDIHFKLKENEGFTINGITVNGESNNTIDRLEAHNGSLISKNLASLLAASVDAVKDPVLNFMNLNTFTCGPAMVLARLGFDIDTIGLIMSQPVIEKVAREYFRQNNDGYTSVEDIINEELENFKTSNSALDANSLEKSVNTNNYTLEKLLKHLNDSVDGNDFQAQILVLFKRLSAMSVNLNNLTFITKFNSISNAVGPTIADTLVMEDRLQRFLQDMENDETAPFNPAAANLLKNSPILKAFYESTMGDRGLSKLIFKDYFPEYSSTFDSVLALLRETTKAPLDSKTINKLVNEFILYKMTMGNSPVISGKFEDRKKFIINFPKSFEKRAEGIINNDLINAIIIEGRDSKCPVATLKLSSSKFSENMQERIRNAWTSLIENEDTFELGRDLFLYNLYRNGFSFSPKTFLHFFSVDSKLNAGMQPYIETISNPTFNDKEVSIQDFLLQFKRNHSSDRRLVPELKEKAIKNKNGTTLTIDGNIDGKKLTITYDKKKNGLNSIIAKKGDTVVFAPVIMYNNKLYYANTYKLPSKGGTIVYTETSELGKANNFLEYNAGEDVVSVFKNLKVKDASKSNKDSSENNTNDPENQESTSDSSPEVNHDNVKKELSEKDIRFLYGDSGILLKYKEDVMALGKEAEEKGNDADEIMTEETLNLLEEYVNKTKAVVAKEKAEEILKRFCRNV